MTQKIRFGHSPDPDDAFMFYAIAKRKIPLGGFAIQHVVEDIESLNQRAISSLSFPNVFSGNPDPRFKHSGKTGVAVDADTSLEATAISVHAFAYVADRYAIMRSGASVGRKYGPVVISHNPLESNGLRGKTIAVPGKFTTAFLILQLFERDFTPVFVPFDKIMDHVLSGKSDAGLIIHEGQITYGDSGLHKVVDLGEWWWEETKLPLALGLDVVKKDLGLEVTKRLSGVFRSSICYAMEHRQEALEYAIQFGRGLHPDLNNRFVAMYVNRDTVDLSEETVCGIRRIFEMASERDILPSGIISKIQWV